MEIFLFFIFFANNSWYTHILYSNQYNNMNGVRPKPGNLSNLKCDYSFLICLQVP
jgi:hypothetical protein